MEIVRSVEFDIMWSWGFTVVHVEFEQSTEREGRKESREGTARFYFWSGGLRKYL